MATTVDFARLTEVESEALDRIVERTRAIYAARDYPEQDQRMDLTAVHAHTPLRLEEFADADDFNFAHDVCGIRRHIDRRTGRLTQHFHPRFAQR